MEPAVLLYGYFGCIEWLWLHKASRRDSSGLWNTDIHTRKLL